MRTNGLDKDKERRIIDLLYDLNAKVAKIEERTKGLTESDRAGRDEIDKLCREIDVLKEKISQNEGRISKLETYIKLIGTVVGMMVMAMLSNIDKIINYIKR